jgi:hypothetical protein
MQGDGSGKAEQRDATPPANPCSPEFEKGNAHCRAGASVATTGHLKTGLLDAAGEEGRCSSFEGCHEESYNPINEPPELPS